MDFVEAILAGCARAVLPQGTTLEHLKPLEDGRLDVLVSHGIAYVIAQNGSPLVAAVYAAARPVVDGALVASCGPSAFSRGRAAVRGKRSKTVSPSTAVTKRRGKAKKPVEILDAEFVDV